MQFCSPNNTEFQPREPEPGESGEQPGEPGVSSKKSKKKNQGTYEVPADSPRQTCLTITKDQRLVLAELGLEGKGQRLLTDDQIRLIKKLKFLDFHRNRHAHRLESLLDWIDKNKSHFNAHGSANIIHVRFPCFFLNCSMNCKLGSHWEVDVEGLF